MAFPFLNIFCRRSHAGFELSTILPQSLGLICLQLTMWSVTVIASSSWCAAQSDSLTQVPVKKISTKLRGFGVPFNVDANDSEYIEVHLYVTKDQGKSWQFYGKQSTDKDEFPFQAEGDGEYWFALKTLNRDRKLLPEGDIQPELKVIIDTVKPTMSCEIDSDPAGRIVCKWLARDSNIDPGSLKILYRAEIPPESNSGVQQPQWHEVPIKIDSQTGDGVMKDQLAWWPEGSSRSYQVRLIVTDSAGNAVHQDSRVVVPLVAWKNKSRSTAVPGGWANRFNRQQTKSTRQRVENQVAAKVSPPVHRQISGKQKMICEGGVCRPVGPGEVLKQNQYPKVELVGSQVEYSVPPPPEPNVMQNKSSQLADTKYPAFQAKSIPWNGKVEDPTGIHHLAVGSTVNSNIAPQQPLRTASGELEIRSLPKMKPEPPAVSPNQRELPGGMVVAESTAARTPSNKRQIAQFNTNSKPPWKGRGEGALAQNVSGSNSFDGKPKAAAAYSTRKEAAPSPSETAPSPSWQNERFAKNGLPTSRSQAAAKLAMLPTNSSGSPSAARTSHRLNVGPPTPMPLNMPNVESMQHLNERRFNLNYNIDAIDPSGVDKVSLWMTRDGGRTWKSWGGDPDGVSPFPVEVEEPGVYGFRVVIQSRDGLTGIAPRRGDEPDMWINVDTDAPFAKITSVPYGRGNEAGRLVVNWQVEDPLLTLRPITLSYASEQQGPWTAIEEGLRNTGRYVWKVGTQVPERVYLRLEAVDQAGNVGVFQLNNMIDISGLVPRGRIMSVEPLK